MAKSKAKLVMAVKIQAKVNKLKQRMNNLLEDGVADLIIKTGEVQRLITGNRVRPRELTYPFSI